MENGKPKLRQLENEEEDDGPPPGFEFPMFKKVDEDDGPPPGFGPVWKKAHLPISSFDKGRTNKQEDVEDDGPPPGWEFTSLARALPKPPSSSSEKEKNNKNKDVEDDDDGPPPGWEFTFRALPKLPSSSSDVKPRVKARNVDEEDDEGPPPGWETVLPHQMPPPCMPQVQSSLNVSSERVQREVRSRVIRPTNRSASAQQMPSPAPQPTEPAATSSVSELELAQLVCGTCRKLCTYPRGEKWVQCPSCLEVNLVMEEHEVGQVACKCCRMLLMYQYGAPAVRCSSCHTVTEIGEHNRRAPLSAQQRQRRRHFNRRR